MLSSQSSQNEDPKQELNTEDLLSLLDKLPFFIFLLAPDFTIPYANHIFHQLFGDPQQRKCYQILANSNDPCSDCPSLKTIVSPEPLHWEYTTSDCKILDVHEFLFVGNNNNRYVLKCGEDITERKTAGYDYAYIGRLNLIAEMAAGIAHEVRNPITTVKGFLQMLGWKSEFNQYQDYYELMITELERANAIITEFLSLTKKQTDTMQLKNLNFIIQTLSPLLQADALRLDITLIEDLGDIDLIELDEKEIRQLILNIVRNGIDASEAGKSLKIRTYMDSGQVVLAISDEGTGIQPEVLDKLCVPFFTTKEGGTGLGLTICNNIVKRHQAKMDVVTSPQGTTFFIIFKPVG